MKKKLFIPLALLFTISLTSAAQKETPSKVQPATPVSYNNSFSRIVVNDGIDLVLTESNQDKIWFDGRSKHLDKLTWEVKNGTLYLASKNGSLSDKVTVNVHVQQLNDLEVNGNSWIRSSGYLSSPSLHVFINGESMVDILNVGKINITHSTDCELDVMKRTRGVSFGGAKAR